MGGEREFHVGVKALVQNDKGEVLLLNATPRHREMKPHWDLPGGRIREGQSIESALKQELQEELSVSPAGVRVRGLFDACISNTRVQLPSGKKLGLLLLVYKCALDSKRNFQLSLEHSEFKWATPGEARTLLRAKYPAEFLRKLGALRG